MAAILLCFRTQVVPVGTNAAQNLERLTFPFTKKEDPVILIQEGISSLVRLMNRIIKMPSIQLIISIQTFNCLPLL
jgi:hypothetical protein